MPARPDVRLVFRDGSYWLGKILDAHEDVWSMVCWTAHVKE